MACKQETKTIGDKSVFVIQWTASKAMVMQVALMNTLGNYAIPFVDNEWDMEHMSYVLTNCDIEKFTKLVRDTCIGARIEGTEVTNGNFDNVMSGDLMFMYKVFAFVLEVNFKDFFAQGRQSADNNQQ